jgi:branched-chain amino acid transport system ATP-binding protein
MTETTGSRLECRDVTVRFGGLIALSNVDLSLPPATTVGLVGPNGAGKSTLFGVLSGLLKPTSGRVFLHGEDVTTLRPQERAARGLARTFQHPELFSGLTVRQHLVLAHRVKTVKKRVWSDLFTLGSLKRPEPAENERVDELIELLGLQQIARRPALGLPLGAARLVELGRALSVSPSVLLLDEPSSGLDSTETEQFEKTLGRVAEQRGISVLLVEHDVELVMRMSRTIHVLDFGMTIAAGTPQQVRGDPRVKAAYLGEEVGESGPDKSRIELSETAAPKLSLPPAALKVEDLSVHYGDAVALSGLSFAVEPGQVLAVLGPNGAGKSSLARALSGLIPASGGRIHLGSDEIGSWSANRIRRAGVVHLPEGRGVFRTMSVLDNLRMAAADLPGRSARREAVELAWELFPALESRRGQLAGSLSGGEQQMLSLARALATSPRLIIADEMSLGLAPMMVDVVFDGLARARSAGISVIMIEQYVHRALGFADRCLVLQRGISVWEGAAADAGSEVLSHYLGEAMGVSS